MNLYTIGFTKKTAEQFFSLLQANEIQRLIDIRVHPGGQLAGFTKKDDLAYFLSRLIDCDYQHLLTLAPSAEILSDYRSDSNWETYVQRFEALMDQRGVPEGLGRQLFEEKTCCLLCSEAAPDKCHRRLVAERFARYWPDITVIHLV